MLGYGFSTDQIFDRFSGIVEENDQFVIVKTPSNPDYYFGNYLLLKTTPTSADLTSLEQAFHALVGEPPTIKHLTFQWTLDIGEKSNVNTFIEKGYKYEENTVLLGDRSSLVSPKRVNEEITIKELQTDAEWDDWLELEVTGKDEDLPLDSFKGFVTEMRKTYRDMIQAGLGAWYGAYIGNELAGSVGVFYQDNLARFQRVMTKEAYRNRGICGTLVHHVSLEASKQAEKLVMVADEHYHAAKIYESLGFKQIERLASLCRWPKDR